MPFRFQKPITGANESGLQKGGVRPEGGLRKWVPVAKIKKIAKKHVF